MPIEYKLTYEDETTPTPATGSGPSLTVTAVSIDRFTLPGGSVEFNIINVEYKPDGQDPVTNLPIYPSDNFVLTFTNEGYDEREVTPDGSGSSTFFPSSVQPAVGRSLEFTPPTGDGTTTFTLKDGYAEPTRVQVKVKRTN